MKIVFQHDSIMPVIKYGGTERVLYWLMKELVQLGHQVILIGNPKSNIQSIGVELIPRTESDWRKHLPKDFSILHLQLTPNFSPDTVNGPVIVTIHGNGRPGELFLENTIFLTKKHAENHNANAYVFNGIDFSEYPFEVNTKLDANKNTWAKFSFLANARWKVKNVKDCVQVCKKLKKDLYIAGGKVFSFSRYIHNCGEVDQKRKIEILRSVDAHLFPVKWHEPFGLSIIEGMSQGLPVIGSNYGSLPELISNRSGIICKNYQDFIEALQYGQEKFSFSREEIRHYVENNFSSKIMALNYLDYYSQVINGKRINKETPKYLSKVSSETLLPF